MKYKLEICCTITILTTLTALGAYMGYQISQDPYINTCRQAGQGPLCDDRAFDKNKWAGGGSAAGFALGTLILIGLYLLDRYRWRDNTLSGNVNSLFNYGATSVGNDSVQQNTTFQPLPPI